MWFTCFSFKDGLIVLYGSRLKFGLKCYVLVTVSLILGMSGLWSWLLSACLSIS